MNGSGFFALPWNKKKPVDSPFVRLTPDQQALYKHIWQQWMHYRDHMDEDELEIPLPPEVHFDFDSFMRFFVKHQRSYLRAGRWSLLEDPLDPSKQKLVFMPQVHRPQFAVAPIRRKVGGRKSRRSKKSKRKSRKTKKSRKSKKSRR